MLPCKLLHKMALVTYPCAFGLSRLARKGCCWFGVRRFSCKFRHKMDLVKTLRAFRLRRFAQSAVGGLGSGVSYQHFLSSSRSTSSYFLSATSSSFSPSSQWTLLSSSWTIMIVIVIIFKTTIIIIIIKTNISIIKTDIIPNIMIHDLLYSRRNIWGLLLE